MQIHQTPSHKITTHATTQKQKTLHLDKPKVMGILNVTPDSFSDGGKYTQLQLALKRCEKMIDEGASIIDIGGESTRPNADEVALADELNRVIPTVVAIRKHFGDDIWLSIDTSLPTVIEEAVKAGADIWNDVRALKRPNAPQMAAKLNIPVVLMHMRGEPKTMGDLAHYDNILIDVQSELLERIDIAISAGVDPSHIIIDPGFGFAKNYDHHIHLLNQLGELHQLNFPILFGVSRKRFLGELLNKVPSDVLNNSSVIDRDEMGMATALVAIQQGVSIVRTHNVGLTMQALTLWNQLQKL